MTGKKLAITGCCGTIGTGLLRELKERQADWPVPGIDNNESGLFAQEQEFGGNCEFAFGDVRELAERVREAARKRGWAGAIGHVPNPRPEAEEHYYNPAYHGLRDLGVVPHPLNGEQLERMLEIAEKYRDSIRPELIMNAGAVKSA